MNWAHEILRDIFFRKGRIEPIPDSYTFVGIVSRSIPKMHVIGVQLESVALKRGDRIAIECPMDFREQTIESLEIDNKPVDEASAGSLVGIRFDDADVAIGMRVFRVNS